MNIKQLLTERDKHAVLWHMLTDFNKGSDMKKGERLKCMTFSALESIRSVEPKDGSGWIVTVGEYIDDIEPIPRRTYIEPTLFSKADIAAKLGDDEVLESGAGTEGWTLQRFDEYFRKRPYVTPWSFEFTEWEEALGYEAWEGSIEQYGVDRCAAAVLHEMMYCGCTPSAVKERIGELFGRDRQTVEADIEDDDEQGLEPQEMSEEEQLESYRASFENWKGDYMRLKKIKEGLVAQECS